jgi:hypothetical protein
MQGKIAVKRGPNGELLKEPVIVKNIDIDFQTCDENFSGVTVLRVNKDEVTIYFMIVLQQQCTRDIILFFGLEYKTPVQYSKDHRMYSEQEIEFTPY